MPLPAVCPPIGAGTGDVISSPTVIAEAAAGDVIDNHAVAFAKAAASRASLHNLTGGLVAGNHPRLIALRAFAEMLVINTAYVGAANCRCFHFQQHFAVAGCGNLKVSEFHGAVSRQDGAFHCLHNFSPLPASITLLLSVQSPTIGTRRHTHRCSAAPFVPARRASAALLHPCTRK